MKKMMTDLIFKKGMRKLEHAFRVKKLSTDTLIVYYERLKEIDEKVFVREIDKIIEKEDFFPSIKCILNYCSPHNQVCL